MHLCTPVPSERQAYDPIADNRVNAPSPFKSRGRSVHGFQNWILNFNLTMGQFFFFASVHLK